MKITQNYLSVFEKMIHSFNTCSPKPYSQKLFKSLVLWLGCNSICSVLAQVSVSWFYAHYHKNLAL